MLIKQNECIIIRASERPSYLFSLVIALNLWHSYRVLAFPEKNPDKTIGLSKKMENSFSFFFSSSVKSCVEYESSGNRQIIWPYMLTKQHFWIICTIISKSNKIYLSWYHMIDYKDQMSNVRNVYVEYLLFLLKIT